MSLSCYIIDDEFHAVEVLVRYVEQTPGIELLGQATNPLEALEAFASGLTPDVIFLDVDMPQINGLELAGLLAPSATVIFTTSFREYAPEAFEKDAADYLLKPVLYPRFLKALTRVRRPALSVAEEKPAAHFFVKSNIKGKFHRISIPEISYIENTGNYITFHFHTRQEPVTTYLTLAEVLTRLPEKDFSRIHQSFVVHHACIVSLEYGQVRLPGPVSLPVGATFRAAFRQKLQGDILISKREQRDG